MNNTTSSAIESLDEIELSAVLGGVGLGPPVIAGKSQFFIPNFKDGMKAAREAGRPWPEARTIGQAWAERGENGGFELKIGPPKRLDKANVMSDWSLE